MTVLQFIDQNFPDSILENKEDEENRFGLPYPYTVPSPGDIFDCMFYWDTHFTNVGLIASGNIQQAIYNTDNIRYMIHRFGYMPNSSKAHHLGQSQPPFYYRMVLDIFRVTKDAAWLDKHYDSIAREYEFWMDNRLAPNGLNYYGKDITQNSEEDILRRYAYAQSRFSGFETDDFAVKKAAAGTVAVLCESGWDCCYRFELDGYAYNPVDLNTLLFGLETAMSQFSEILGRGEEQLWRDRAFKRKALMDQFLYNPEKGFYMDWNFRSRKFSPVISVASLFPLYLGLSHNPESIIRVLENELLLPYGVSPTTVPEHNYQMQWEYPNIWAPLQFVAYSACINSGFTELADTIAKRYVDLIEANYEKTGILWEKYNGLTGDVVNAEYNAPPMMGWTAGVYLFFKKTIQN